jgi:hypothetical protein
MAEFGSRFASTIRGKWDGSSPRARPVDVMDAN